jgi:PIN domain nuclease of toxin-antitoxin system
VTFHNRAVLLDTCAVIWLARGKLRPATVDLLVYAGSTDGVFVSPVSAWEIGLLAYPRIGRARVDFLPDPIGFFARVMGEPTIREAPLTAEAATNSARLPPPLHNDPADRLLVATAREKNLAIVTRDQRILDYAALGHLQAVAC